MIPAAHVIFILDDSGSMMASTEITKKSFDGMVESLQLCKGADIVMSLIKYGSKPVLTYPRKHIQDVAPVSYAPNSGDDTIYDSLLFAIELAEQAPRDEKTIIILQADGGDTCSRARPDAVNLAVTNAKRKGVEFLFLGANYHPDDSPHANMRYDWGGKSGNDYYPGSKKGILTCAELVGISPEEVMFYDSGASKESTAAFAETASNIGSVASRLTEHAAYTDEQKARVKK